MLNGVILRSSDHPDERWIRISGFIASRLSTIHSSGHDLSKLTVLKDHFAREVVEFYVKHGHGDVRYSLVYDNTILSYVRANGGRIRFGRISLDFMGFFNSIIFTPSNDAPEDVVEINVKKPLSFFDYLENMFIDAN